MLFARKSASPEGNRKRRRKKKKKKNNQKKTSTKRKEIYFRKKSDKTATSSLQAFLLSPYKYSPNPPHKPKPHVPLVVLPFSQLLPAAIPTPSRTPDPALPTALTRGTAIAPTPASRALTRTSPACLSTPTEPEGREKGWKRRRTAAAAPSLLEHPPPLARLCPASAFDGLTFPAPT